MRSLLLIENIAKNMWLASQRNSCKYFDDIHDLIQQWETCIDKHQMIINASSFVEILSKDHPIVYEYILRHYHAI